MSSTLPGHDLAMNLRCAYFALHRASNACFAPFGVTADSFILLTALAEHGPLAQKDLVIKISSDANTVSVMINRLEQEKVVIRNRDMQDGRKRIIHLTAKGKRLQRKLWNKSQSIRNCLENLLSPNEFQSTLILLKRITEVLENNNQNKKEETDVD